MILKSCTLTLEFDIYHNTIMSHPKVSICIPTYQQIEYLKKTLDSIQIQDFTDYEVIITDDSRDNSVKYLVETYSSYLPIRYYLNEKQLGSPENWNQSISYARGEYIKIMHHDDWFTSRNSLGLFVKLLDDNPDSIFGFSSALAFDNVNNTSRIHKTTKNQINKLIKNPETLFLGNVIGGPSVTIYRRTVEDEYNNKLKWLVDLEFYIRVINKNKKFCFYQEPLISCSNGLENQVTKSCINNPQIDFFEHIYLYNKLSQKNKYSLNYLFHLLMLFRKYKITSWLKLQEVVKDECYQEELVYRKIIAFSKLLSW